MIDSLSLHKLHSNCCMGLYGCELWNYNSRYINDLYVALRKVTRKLFKLPYRTHNYLVCGIVECITVKLDRRLTKFEHSMINSKNSTVLELIAHFLTTESSVIAENCRYLMYKTKCRQACRMAFNTRNASSFRTLNTLYRTQDSKKFWKIVRKRRRNCNDPSSDIELQTLVNYYTDKFAHQR